MNSRMILPVMRNSARRGIVGLLAVTMGSMAMLSLPGSAAAADAHEATSSPSAYAAWLEAQPGAHADRTAVQFKALPADKQQRFLDYISDPQIAAAMVSASGEAAPARTELANGDVVVEHKSGTGPAARTGDMHAWHSTATEVLGVTVDKVLIRVNYRVTGYDTNKVYAGSAQSEESVPCFSIEHSPVDEWISAEPADNAHSETIWTADWCGKSWSARHRVWADYSGYKGGYLKRD